MDDELVKSLDAKSGAAYIAYIEANRRPECLGWAAKVRAGQFGEPELKAHCLAAERLGMHRAFAAAASEVAAWNRRAPVGAEPAPKVVAPVGYATTLPGGRAGIRWAMGGLPEGSPLYTHPAAPAPMPGWRVVPEVPTAEMLVAGAEHVIRTTDVDPDDERAVKDARNTARGCVMAAYMDMLSAAPAPRQEEASLTLSRERIDALWREAEFSTYTHPGYSATPAVVYEFAAKVCAALSSQQGRDSGGGAQSEYRYEPPPSMSMFASKSDYDAAMVQYRARQGKTGAAATAAGASQTAPVETGGEK